MIRIALFAIALMLAGVAVGLIVSRIVRPSAPSQKRTEIVRTGGLTWPMAAAIAAFAAAAAIVLTVAITQD